MATNTPTPVEASGAYSPQDYSLKTLNFLTASGKRIELKKIMMEFSYYEDIYTFAASGYVTLVDAQGFIELLQLTGNEYLEVNFGKVKNGPNGNDQIFRVYKIGDRKPGGNHNTEVYTLHFCSEELMLSEQTKISKSYSGQKVSEIVQDVLIEKLKVKPKNINIIEETTGVYDFVVPRLKPFEAISWVSTYARPKKQNSTADMLFFETKEGFNFRSLQSMYKDSVYATYKYEPMNLDNKKQNFQEKAYNVIEYEFSKTYDALQEITSGSFANRLISIDPLTRSFNITDFDYNKMKNTMEKLNPSGVLNELKNRFDKALNQSPEGVLKVATGNANHGNVPYIKEKEGGFAKDIFIETILPLRTAAISLANFTAMKMAVPGDPGLTAGKVIEFNLFTLKPTNNTKELDKFYSGKYLVTAVRHIIKQTAYQTILEVAKESLPKAQEGANNSDKNVRQAITA